MDVITIESKAFRELETKIDSIAKFVTDFKPATVENQDETWVDNYDVCSFLKISERTLQRLRTKGLISYSIISGKSYYTISELKRVLSERLVRRNEECLQELIKNHNLYAEKRRMNKGKK
ncbi:MAG: helix-turn-helix domain-containing protein [Paludibacter sp.]|nr:helix-turn-helix domain-containing protein [Paludibacter sp.]